MPRRSRLVGLALVATLVLAACAKEPVLTYDGTNAGPPQHTVLTPDRYDQYTFASATGTMDVATLDHNSGGNLRALWWPADGPSVADSQTCATWASEDGGGVQQGAALRIVSENGRTRALTVTKNIWYGGTWIFNFHVWDTARSPAFAQIGSVSLERTFRPGGVTRPLPWQFCARAIDATLEFKAWPASVPEPAWGDPAYGGRVTVPPGWTYPGTAGWYVGHVPPGGGARYTDLQAWKYVVPETLAPEDPPPAGEPTEPESTEATSTPAEVTVSSEEE